MINKVSFRAIPQSPQQSKGTISTYKGSTDQIDGSSKKTINAPYIVAGFAVISAAAAFLIGKKLGKNTAVTEITKSQDAVNIKIKKFEETIDALKKQLNEIAVKDTEKEKTVQALNTDNTILRAKMAEQTAENNRINIENDLLLQNNKQLMNTVNKQDELLSELKGENVSAENIVDSENKKVIVVDFHRAKKKA